MAKIVGHKGAAGYAPENTLSSFRMAIELGCDRAELDVQKTKDGQAVVFHDTDVSNLTNGNGLIHEMTLAELKKLDCGQGEKIPALEEVIEICKNKINLQIELKADGTPELVNDLILRNNIQSTTVITSFRVDLLKEMKQLNSNLQIGLLFNTPDVMKKIWNLADEIPLDFLAPFAGLIDKEFIDKAHRLGKSIYAYRVNEKELGETLIAMGVDDIGTDFPKLFI